MRLSLLASLATIFVWLVHVGAVSVYQNWLSDTKSLLFRATHGLEINILATLGFLIFFKLVPKTDLAPSLIAGLLTLAVIDLIFFASFPKVWANFDLLHVIVAYSAFAIGICLAKILT